ncbi:MAG: UDP-glucose 4-epimerase GalE [Fusobacterium sp.]|nr:UDP-glucose 4-epimerase GalE [Fusobacterium sp.]
MILVTGGAGYIGSHCVLKLKETGEEVVVFDNLSTGHIETIEKLGVEFVQGDLRNSADIQGVFDKFNIDAVVHFAAFSQVGESVKEPYKYFQNNVCGSLNLLDAMVKHDVKKIVFSSTAATYGEPVYTPIDENHPQKPINPYGETKLTVEMIMDDFDKAYGLKSVRLRYFNVAGADEAGRIGEWHDPETHLIPNVLKAAFGSGKTFKLFGDDYNTKDGTCVRDYIDVNDLIDAHLLALKYLQNGGETNVFNLGTKTGSTVKEVFAACEDVTGMEIPLEICPRREGDPATLVADNSKALATLGWNPSRTLENSVQSAWAWEQKLQKFIK